MRRRGQGGGQGDGEGEVKWWAVAVGAEMGVCYLRGGASQQGGMERGSGGGGAGRASAHPVLRTLHPALTILPVDAPHNLVHHAPQALVLGHVGARGHGYLDQQHLRGGGRGPGPQAAADVSLRTAT